MSYQDIVSMAENRDLWMRLVACAAQEQPGDPIQWVQDHVFKLCAQPDWDTAWASAAANNVANPGTDPSVITDAMILSGTQSVLGIVSAQAQQQQAEVQAQVAADHQRTLEITRAAATAQLATATPDTTPDPAVVQLAADAKAATTARKTTTRKATK